MILFIHLTSETCLIFQKAVSTFFFLQNVMRWEVSLRISSKALEVTGLDRPRRLSCQTPQKSPRRCHWVMSNEKTKNNPTYRCMQDTKTHTWYIDTSCTRQKHIMQTWYLPGPIQTYPKNTHANLPLWRTLDMDGNVRKKSAASKMWALLDKKSNLNMATWNFEILGLPSTCFSMTQGFRFPKWRLSTCFAPAVLPVTAKPTQGETRTARTIKSRFVNVKHLHATHDANVHRNRIAMEVSWSRGKLK